MEKIDADNIDMLIGWRSAALKQRGQVLLEIATDRLGQPDRSSTLRVMRQIVIEPEATAALIESLQQALAALAPPN